MKSMSHRRFCAGRDRRAESIEKGQSIRKHLVAEHGRVLGSPLNEGSSGYGCRSKSGTAAEHGFPAAHAGGVGGRRQKPDGLDLQQATALAKLTAETAQVDQLKSGIEEVRKRTQQEADRQFAADGAAISTEVDQKLTPQLLASSSDDYSQQLQSLRKKIDGLRDPGASVPISAKLNWRRSMQLSRGGNRNCSIYWRSAMHSTNCGSGDRLPSNMWQH